MIWRMVESCCLCWEDRTRLGFDKWRGVNEWSWLINCWCAITIRRNLHIKYCDLEVHLVLNRMMRHSGSQRMIEIRIEGKIQWWRKGIKTHNGMRWRDCSSLWRYKVRLNCSIAIGIMNYFRKRFGMKGQGEVLGVVFIPSHCVITTLCAIHGIGYLCEIVACGRYGSKVSRGK